MMSARAKGVFNPELLRGRGAWIDEGRTILHFGNGLIIDGEETPLTEYSGRYIYERAEALPMPDLDRSEEHTSELQSLMRISYAVFCLKQQRQKTDSK